MGLCSSKSEEKAAPTKAPETAKKRIERKNTGRLDLSLIKEWHEALLPDDVVVVRKEIRKTTDEEQERYAAAILKMQENDDDDTPGSSQCTVTVFPAPQPWHTASLTVYLSFISLTHPSSLHLFVGLFS